MTEVVTFAIRQWAPDAPLPTIEAALGDSTRAQVRFLYSTTNSVMQRLGTGSGSRIVVFVDQRVRTLHADGLIEMITGEGAEWDGIVSPQIAVGGEEPEPWHEPINPYAWAARGFVVATLRPAWEAHLQFSHETLMVDAAIKAEIEMVCNRLSVAEVEAEGPASAVVDALYYRQLEDAAAAASVLGVEGPSA